MIESDLKSFCKVFHFSAFNFGFHRRSVRKWCTLLNLLALSLQHNAGTSATLTVCVTILICCFAWTTTSATLSSPSSPPRAGNFNWPLVLFYKDGKLQFKKIDEWKRGGSTFSPSKCSQGFSCSFLATTDHKRLLPQNLIASNSSKKTQ